MFLLQYHMLVSHILSAVQHMVPHVPNVALDQSSIIGGISLFQNW